MDGAQITTHICGRQMILEYLSPMLYLAGEQLGGMCLTKKETVGALAAIAQSLGFTVDTNLTQFAMVMANLVGQYRSDLVFTDSLGLPCVLVNVFESAAKVHHRGALQARLTNPHTIAVNILLSEQRWELDALPTVEQ